ncbi:hypothetical protein HOLleu_21481 [Holothuria leucospilota]|uniref:Ig-like domain-containing protein n=1 Tax=Holothuria leucospilota TaxID=206669 RepID=A0A9Q1BXR8_HOLLE|nr:hypothetical protein HOLleu_21481 [Holothuria leucospilota]
MHMLYLSSVLSMCLYSNIGFSSIPFIVRKTILFNTSVNINCSLTSNVSLKHVWWFNGKIIFANGIQPSEIGISNAQGNFMDKSGSYIHFDGFSEINSGIYTCTEGDVLNAIYHLDVELGTGGESYNSAEQCV